MRCHNNILFYLNKTKNIFKRVNNNIHIYEFFVYIEVEDLSMDKKTISIEELKEVDGGASTVFYGDQKCAVCGKLLAVGSNAYYRVYKRDTVCVGCHKDVNMSDENYCLVFKVEP